MSVPDIEPVKTSSGDGLNKIFDYGFQVNSESEMLVQHTNSDGAQKTLVLNTDYSITGIGNKNGGNVFFPLETSTYAVLSSGEKLTRSLDLSFKQEGGYDKSGGLSLIALENSLDYQTRMSQILRRKIDRCVKVKEGSGADPDSLIENIDASVIAAGEHAASASGFATASSESAADSQAQVALAANQVVLAAGQVSLAEGAISTFMSTYEGALQDVVDGKEEIETQAILSINQLKEAGYGLPPSICKNLMIKKVGVNVSLKWEDSGNTILDEKYICTWAGTKIVKRLGGYPRNETDGVLVVDNLINNQYLNSAYVDVLADSGENWYYAAFPYSTNGAYCYNAKNNFTEAIVYEFCINPNDANPVTRVTRPVDSVNKDFVHAYMNFGSGAFNYGSWEHAFFMPRPVMVKYDGTVDYELYKQNFNYKADGVTPSGIANTAYGGNVMIAFPQVWFKFVMDGTLQHVYISNKQVDENYKCYTHYNRLGVLLDEIFINAYQPCNVSSKLRSLSGQTIYVGAAGTTEIAYAQANGDGWYLWDYAFFNMMNMLLVLMCGSTNIQSKFGEGRSSAANATTGECNDKGMFYGTSANGAVKIFGIENYYGNYWKRTAGCVYTAAGMKYKMTESTLDGSSVVGYNTDGTGYLTHQTFSGTSGGYISAASLTANGIFPTVASGSSSTYFSDGLWWAAGGYAFVGGACGSGALGGSFCLSLGDAVSGAGAGVGASLSCKPL